MTDMSDVQQLPSNLLKQMIQISLHIPEVSIFHRACKSKLSRLSLC